MITRSFTNGMEVTDWTEEINIIPNQWGTIGKLGIFTVEPVAEHSVTFEKITKDGAIIVDRVRGERGSVGKDASRKIHTFAVPHFPYDDYISPQDVQGKRAYGSATEAETLAAVRTRKMERIRQNHAWTLEVARAQALSAGTVYAPNGTVTQNWNTEFGVTRKTVDFVLGTAGTDVIAKIEECIAYMQDNAFGVNISGLVVLTSPELFGKLISHASVKSAYTYYTSTQEPLRQRLGGDMVLNREFSYGGLRFVEMRDVLAGTRIIPVGKAFVLPQGTDVFKTYFSPANRFGLVNTLGEQVYMFENADPKGTKIEIESESNHVSALLRPDLLVEISSSN
jgi:hypothetical protein